MSTNKTISQKVTRQQTLGSEAPQPLCLLYPSQLKRKKKKVFCYLPQHLFCQCSTAVISSYRLFLRTAQTNENYSFGTVMLYNLIP